MSVSNILSVKGRNVFTARGGDKIGDIVKTLAEKRIGAIVVTDAAGKIEGIVSERDVVRHLAKEGATLLTKSVSAIMTRNVKTCAEGDDEQELMTLMTENRIRHLPVVSAGKLAGMVSIGDVVKHRIECIEREADHMKAYIAGAA
jgi:CBS domain-containing protein